MMMIPTRGRGAIAKLGLAQRGFASMSSILGQQLEEIKVAGTHKEERVILGPQQSEILVKEGKVLNFCANNYLGLANHPEVVAAGKKAMDEYGFGLSSVRFICGTQQIHKELEKTIAEFHGTDDTILYPSCFDANAGLFEAILTNQDAIISDALNHASIIDGVRLCKAKRFRYEHSDMVDLENKLIEAKDARMRLIATDGVFSMDGDIARLKDICNLAEKHDAQIFIDECHATGFIGETGRGTIEHCDVNGRVAIINSTLGKALGGGTGGYTTGIQEVVDILRQKSRPYLFSNSVAPSVVGASLKVFEMLNKEAPVQKVRQNTELFRSRLSEAGFDIIGEGPIVPVMLGDARLATDFANKLLAEGIYVIGFSYPVVPLGKARIRTQISASHTPEQIIFAADAFEKVGKEMGIIS